MKKEIEAIYYFKDIATISLLSIFGFSLGIIKWLGVVCIGLMTLFLIFTTVYLHNKYRGRKHPEEDF